MLTLLASLALAVEVTRPPEKVETEPRVAVPADATDLAASKAGKKAYEQLVELARLRALDMVVRGQAEALSDCPVSGEAQARISVGTDGRAKASPAKDAPVALGDCLRRAFDDAPLPLMLERGAALDYTFRVPGGEAAVDPIDRDGGFLGVPFGAKLADVEGLSAGGSPDKGVTMVQRVTDRGLMLGEPPTGVAYGFGPDGLTVVMVRFTGRTSVFNVRAALKQRYGQPRVDAKTRQPYWRGEDTLMILGDAGEDAVLVLMDLHRAKALRYLDLFPGEPDKPPAVR